jgi:hypothetical protein
VLQGAHDESFDLQPVPDLRPIFSAGWAIQVLPHPLLLLLAAMYANTTATGQG